MLSIVNRIPRNSNPLAPWDLSGNTILHYKKNDDAANTTVTDDGSGATNGTSSTNTSNLSVAGKINDAFDYDSGSSEFVDANQTLQATWRGDFSWSIWIKPNDGQPAAAEVLFGTQNAGGQEKVLLSLMTTGVIRVFYATGGGGAEADARTNVAVFPDGATSWTHIFVTCDTSNIKIYINTVEVALDGVFDGDMSLVTKTNMTLANNLYVGANNDGTDTAEQFVDGLEDDFRIYDKICTQDEINGVYNLGAGTEAQSGP